MSGNAIGTLLLSAEDHGKVLLALFIALVAAKLMAELFERLRQPAVVGEIIAGIIVGPALLNWSTAYGCDGRAGRNRRDSRD